MLKYLLVVILSACSLEALPANEYDYNIRPGQYATYELIGEHFNHWPPYTTRVRWVTSTCAADNASISYLDKCYAGLMFKCNLIYVAIDPDMKVSSTALAHELVHCILLDKGVSADPGHELKEVWSRVLDVNAELRQHGW